jgi:hypothetical protein
VGGALRFGQFLSATLGVTTQEDGSVGWTISRDQFHNPASANRFSPRKRPENFHFLSDYLTAVLFLRKLAALLGRP